MKNIKKIIICFSAGLIGGFSGVLLHEIISKPDGDIYLDKEDKNIYAVFKNDPDEYKNNSRVVFLYHK